MGLGLGAAEAEAGGSAGYHELQQRHRGLWRPMVAHLRVVVPGEKDEKGRDRNGEDDGTCFSIAWYHGETLT